MIEFFRWVGIGLLILFSIPFLVFVSAKLWAYGTLRGKQLFRENSKKKREESNNQKEEHSNG